jgi:hypothetical protein
MKNIYKIDENIYVSSDEEIKEGDYVTNGKYVSQAINEWWTKFYIGNPELKSDYWKIVLTTDQNLIKDGVQSIDDDYVEWLSCEYVLLENKYIQKKEFTGDKRAVQCEPCAIKMIQEEPLNLDKLESQLDNALSKETKESLTNSLDSKRNKETLEEAAEWFSDDEPNCDYEAGIKTGKYQGFFEGAKWQSERMYSEEDMREAIILCLDGMYGYQWGKEGQTENQINKYLQKLKNK